MQTERRDLYRVKPGPRDSFTVSLIDGTGTPYPARIIDLSARGAGARVSSNDAPQLDPGTRVTLAFNSPGLSKPLEVRAALAKSQDDEGGRYYGFQFLAERDVAHVLPPNLFRLFNRRGAYRVSDPRETPIEMRPYTDGRGDAGDVMLVRLKTLSTTGLGALGPADEPPGFAHAELIHAAIELPGLDAPLQVVAWLRNREAYRESTYYGLEFDMRRTPNYLDVAEDIIAFVMERMDPALADRPH